MSTTNTPLGAYNYTGVWTGTEMIVWGSGHYDGGSHYFNTGGRYDPKNNTWVATSSAPWAAAYNTAVWTGSEMIVWGRSNSGLRYNPATDNWTTITTINAP